MDRFGLVLCWLCSTCSSNEPLFNSWILDVGLDSIPFAKRTRSPLAAEIRHGLFLIPSKSLEKVEISTSIVWQAEVNRSWHEQASGLIGGSESQADWNQLNLAIYANVYIDRSSR